MNTSNQPDGVLVKSDNIKGMVWMLVAGVLFSINFSVIRTLGQDLNVFEIVFFRNLFGFVVFIPWLIRASKDELTPTRPWLVASRGLLQALALSAWYSALMVVPLAQATSLSMLEPIFTSLLAILILREKSSAARWIIVAVGFAGSMIIIRPGFEAVRLESLLVLFSTSMWGIYVIAGKILTRTDSVAVVVAYPTLMVVPLAFIPALFFWQWPSLEQWGLFVVTGILSSSANFAITKSYQIGDITAMAPIGFSRLIFAAIVGFVVFSEVPEIWVWIGGGVIVAAGTMLARIEVKSKEQ